MRRPAAGCTYQDEHHAVGDVWSAGDGCNSCSCISDGDWRCSLVACDGGLPSDAGMDAATLTR